MNAPTPRHPSVRQRGEQAKGRGLVLFTLGLLAAGAVAVLTVRVLLAVFAGILFAIVLRAVASFVARHLHAPYALVLTTLVLLLLGGTVLAVVFAVPLVADELDKLRSALPPAVHRLADSFGYGDVLERGGKLENLHLDKVATRLLATVGTTFDALAGLVICFFVAIYGAADPDAYSRAVLVTLPVRHRPLARAIMQEATSELGRWLLGRLVAMLFVAVSCGVAFVLLGVPLAIPLAVLAGLLTFVEYVGAIASAIPAILLAFSQGPLTALWVALTYTALHIVEGYVLTPLLARNAVKIPPALTLVGQGLFGALVGSLGLTFSTPLLVVAISAVKEWRQRAAHERTRAGEPAPSTA
jgi:predicted PurR-regulated permease PerM